MLPQQQHIIGYDLLASSSTHLAVLYTTNSRGLSQRAELLPNQHPLCFPYREFRHCAGDQVGLMMASMLYERAIIKPILLQPWVGVL